MRPQGFLDVFSVFFKRCPKILATSFSYLALHCHFYILYFRPYSDEFVSILLFH